MLGREGPYAVRGRGRFGKPELLRLRDYNGDGEPLEVAFFDAESSSDLLTMVVGYEPRVDRLRQYTFHVIASERGGATRVYDTDWLEGLFWFGVQPHRPPRWKFQADYPGGPHEWYDVSFDARERRFNVRLVQRPRS